MQCIILRRDQKGKLHEKKGVLFSMAARGCEHWLDIPPIDRGLEARLVRPQSIWLDIAHPAHRDEPPLRVF
ncbi:hypothetical protein PoB_001974100 [Plakobranchus ocellatus]|uniref:Uncharacterized protein n=1 Tax=Plakobranchus ocellatus TaxID=259542 RepID=A0AAV3ZF38_9GAST|nr:hypothetical protein PoB_001974100 [Plakobranchus ocellatus]